MSHIPPQPTDAEVLEHLHQLNTLKIRSCNVQVDTKEWKQLDKAYGLCWIWFAARNITIYLHDDGIWRLYHMRIWRFED